MAIRSTGSGTVTFGMVSIPVKVYTATSPKSVKFNMLTKSGNRVGQKLYDKETGIEVARNETVKGYEVKNPYGESNYVVVTDEELKALRPTSDKCMEILEFVPLEKVDPVYFEKSHLLGPDKGGNKPYHMLREAMLKSGQVAIGRYRVRGKENLIVLRPTHNGIMMHTLYFHDEVRDFEDLGLDHVDIPADEGDLALKLVNHLSKQTFTPEKYEDRFRTDVLDLIDHKLNGEEFEIEEVEERPDCSMVEALRASLK